MEGCSAPLVVKFADTQREKEQKKIQQMHSTILNNIATGNGLTSTLTSTGGGITLSAGGSTGGSGSPSNSTNSGQNATTLSAATSPLLTNPPQQTNPYLATDAATAAAMTPTSLQLLQQLQAVGLQHQFMQGLIYFQNAYFIIYLYYICY